MATRAIHIEVASALDTSSFMNAFRRFSCRRGYPTDVSSDNGTSFVGADREMREGVRKLNSSTLDAALLRKGVNWHFNLPAASHQGGIWERMIRTIRKILRVMTHEYIMTEEQLSTFLVETEKIINDRPLTPVSDHPHDLSTLSPRALLLRRLDTTEAPDVFIKADGYRRSWRAVQLLLDRFWQC